jgi:hypothetical protein
VRLVIGLSTAARQSSSAPLVQDVLHDFHSVVIGLFILIVGAASQHQEIDRERERCVPVTLIASRIVIAPPMAL